MNAQDFTVVDNGVTQKDLAIRSTQNTTPPQLILLFDLLNSSVRERGYMKQQLQSLNGLPKTESVDLYLLTAVGKLYPVGAVSDTNDPPKGALLEQALKEAPVMGSADLKRKLERTKATYSALDDLCSLIKTQAGAKQLFWVTYGIPSKI